MDVRPCSLIGSVFSSLILLMLSVFSLLYPVESISCFGSLSRLSFVWPRCIVSYWWILLANRLIRFGEFSQIFSNFTKTALWQQNSYRRKNWTLSVQKKIKVHRFTNNLQGLQKVVVKDFSWNIIPWNALLFVKTVKQYQFSIARITDLF